MTETRAYNRGHHHIYEQTAEPALRRALVTEHTRHKGIAHGKPYGERQTVPSHRQRAEREQNRIGVPHHSAGQPGS